MSKRYILLMLMALGAVVADNSRVNTCVAMIDQVLKLKLSESKNLLSE